MQISVFSVNPMCSQNILHTVIYFHWKVLVSTADVLQLCKCALPYFKFRKRLCDNESNRNQRCLMVPYGGERSLSGKKVFADSDDSQQCEINRRFRMTEHGINEMDCDIRTSYFHVI